MTGVRERVVIVTGGANGIGAAHSRMLAAHGAWVVVNDAGVSRDGTGTSEHAADATADEIASAGGTATADYNDISSPEGAADLVEHAVATFGRVDAVVNNAGILRDRSFGKMSYEEWDAVLKVHLYGPFNVCRAAWPHFRSQQFGRIIMTASQSGFYGNFGQANYGAAKMGQVGLMNALAIEGRAHNILVNTISPTAATRMTEGLFASDSLAKLDPEFAAPVVVQLASEELTDTGLIVLASGMGYSRIAVFKSPGVVFKAIPEPADIRGAWSTITSLEGATPGAPLLGEDDREAEGVDAGG